ncbi:MAG: hypothetical protein ABI113_22875 [Mucilaginibacter sp.]
MRINLAIVVSVLSFTASSCLSSHNNGGQNTANFPVKPLIIFDNKEDGWGGDIRLSIVNINESDSSTLYKAVSDYKGKKLGLLIFIPKAKESSNGFGKGIILKSMGEESDNLLNTLAELYKQHIDPNSKFISSVSVGYVDLSEFAKSLTGKTDDASSATGEYKLFFENKGDEAELFLNINPNDKWVDLREKDEEYRPSVIKALKN